MARRRRRRKINRGEKDRLNAAHDLVPNMIKAIRVFTVLLALLGSGVLAGFVVCNSSHGGDFTWRQQAMIGALRAPVYAIGSIYAVLVLAQAYRCRGERADRAAWFLAAVIAIFFGLTVALFVHPLDSLIRTWNANVPPPDWNVVKERRIIGYVTALILGALSLLAVARASLQRVEK